MKNIKYLLAFFGIAAIVACEPNADILDEIEKEEKEALSAAAYKTQFEEAPSTYTLTDDDYALSSNESVANYKNFSNSAPVGEYLPEILKKKFVAEDKFEMEVYYNFYQRVNPDEDNAVELSSDDYNRMGQSYSNFEDEDAAEYAISAYVNELFRYEPFEAGTERTVQYTIYEKGLTRYLEVKDNGDVVVLDDEPDNYYELTDSDYETLGYGRYHNFSYIDQAQESIPNLGYSHDFYACEVYNNYLDYYLVYRFDGNVWNQVNSVMEESTVFSYSWNEENYAESYWWKDPNVYITMGVSDYQVIVDYVADNFGAEYTPFSDSEIYYGASAHYANFDLREDNRELSEFPTWEEAVEAALAEAYLPTIASEPVAQRYGFDVLYVITFDTYDGGSGQYEMQFKVTSEAPDPQFELVEGPTSTY